DDGRTLVPENAEQVADTARVGPERVVAAWLGGLAVAEEVWRHDAVPLGEPGQDVAPRRGAACDAVAEEDDRAAARRTVRDAVAVQADLLRRHELRLSAIASAGFRGRCRSPIQASAAMWLATMCTGGGFRVSVHHWPTKATIPTSACA